MTSDTTTIPTTNDTAEQPGPGIVNPPQNAAQPQAAESDRGQAPPPITVLRITECLDSARFWTDVLSFHADRLQKKADDWAIAAGLLAAIAGLSAWKDLVVDNATDNPWLKALTSVLALAAAACALVPRIKNYGETAGQARELATRYGQLTGPLTDVQTSLRGPTSNTSVQGLVKEFDAIKKTKDSMRDVPVRSEETRKYVERRRTPRNLRGVATPRIWAKAPVEEICSFTVGKKADFTPTLSLSGTGKKFRWLHGRPRVAVVSGEQLPDGLNVDPQTGRIHGVPAQDTARSDDYEIELQANNRNNVLGNVKVKLHVADPIRQAGSSESKRASGEQASSFPANSDKIP